MSLQSANHEQSEFALLNEANRQRAQHSHSFRQSPRAPRTTQAPDMPPSQSPSPNSVSAHVPCSFVDGGSDDDCGSFQRPQPCGCIRCLHDSDDGRVADGSFASALKPPESFVRLVEQPASTYGASVV